MYGGEWVRGYMGTRVKGRGVKGRGIKGRSCLDHIHMYDVLLASKGFGVRGKRSRG
jgi:hypothetical protein